ncbi:WhiB family transcriptional regulator [Streptomyces sp. EN27]|uniref:4Fe-4S Wbl-type domain-containing protein n=1 Tax=Streptomyces sp. EN27 TaxID=211464 RepID=Q8GGE4_9ACTN|nr:WhiB family transcriptional regulator [Streptomyces sp. EN27]AAN76282.1 unknown [Streptomyces sp. EN27]
MKLSTNAAALAWSDGPDQAPACKGVNADLFFPKASSAADGPTAAERTALAFCAGCPVREWCLERDLDECTVTSRIVGVRGGLREADRRALHVRRYGVRAPYRAKADR